MSKALEYDITWKEIEAECGGYRAGFVAAFRKHEGQRTDEVDAQGRMVKVTAKSFSRHVGVENTTFRRWLGEKQHDRGASPGQTRSGQMGRQIAKSPKVTVEDKVGMLKDLVSDKKVLRAFREERAPKVSEADAKAASAVVGAFSHQLSQAAVGLAVPAWLDWLKEITDGLAEYEYDETTVNKLAHASASAHGRDRGTAVSPRPHRRRGGLDEPVGVVRSRGTRRLRRRHPVHGTVTRRRSQRGDG